jgi:hypothetical protein
MKPYWVEGLYLSKKTLKKVKRGGKYSTSDVEPFAMPVWASSPAEALRLATDQLDGGEWIEPPRVSQTTEEQRMRSSGAPELPLFGSKKASKR